MSLDSQSSPTGPASVDSPVPVTATRRPPAIPKPVAARRRAGRVTRYVAIAWLSLVVGLSLLAPVLPLPGISQGGFGIALRPLGSRILGTDELGRDMFTRIVFGARTSLWVAVLSVGLAMVLGVALGLCAGYFRGWFDTVVTAFADIVLSFPGLILLMVVAALAGPSVRNLVLAIAVFQLPTFIRLSRASTMTFTQREFVHAARGLGARDARVTTREILPNVVPTLTAYALAAVGVVFVVEGSVSFLGLGIQPPTPAWGSMIASGRPMLTTAPHIVLTPAIVLFLTVLAFNTLADNRRAGGRPTRLGGG